MLALGDPAHDGATDARRVSLSNPDEGSFCGTGEPARSAGDLQAVVRRDASDCRASEQARITLSTCDDPGRLARDAYTYLHLPIVAGIIATAVGTDLLIAAPHDALHGVGVAMMLGGPALFLVGESLFAWRMTGTANVTRVAVAGFLVLLVLIGGQISALLLGMTIAALLTALVPVPGAAERPSEPACPERRLELSTSVVSSDQLRACRLAIFALGPLEDGPTLQLCVLASKTIPSVLAPAMSTVLVNALLRIVTLSRRWRCHRPSRSSRPA